MRLQSWLEETGWTVPKLAKELKCSRANVYAWLNGDYFPSTQRCAQLQRITKGKVTAADFSQKPEVP